MNWWERVSAELRHPETIFLVLLMIWSVAVVSVDLLRR